MKSSFRSLIVSFNEFVSKTFLCIGSIFHRRTKKPEPGWTFDQKDSQQVADTIKRIIKLMMSTWTRNLRTGLRKIGLLPCLIQFSYLIFHFFLMPLTPLYSAQHIGSCVFLWQFSISRFDPYKKTCVTTSLQGLKVDDTQY